MLRGIRRGLDYSTQTLLPAQMTPVIVLRESRIHEYRNQTPVDYYGLCKRCKPTRASAQYLSLLRHRCWHQCQYSRRHSWS